MFALVDNKDFDRCYSYVGRTGLGAQPLSIGPGCEYLGIVIHELMHAIGFEHEQSRADRDNYVNILWDNIKPGAESQFAKYTLAQIQHLGEPYDYASVMHYEKNAFSKRRDLPTIEPKRAGVRMGQRRGFSHVDIRKINKLYGCKGRSEDLTGEFYPITLVYKN
ncbi:MEP1B [Cordylochernes scorpioides]|uniref:Metalloendopeptidase n=1 Tax=Cordylochernes scorpioides TaxID=51811 RepID=A0ABY6LXY5_9ARAC|nr:MEP1B [Cordylochernes scorpioides]